MSYAPAPGTVAFRVLAHMELLHKGSEISTGTLNTALGIESDRLIPGLEAAIKHRAIFRRKKGGHPRSPVFWSLVDHSKDSHEAPPPGPQTARVTQTFDRGTSRQTANQVAAADLHQIASSPDDGDGSMSSLLRMVKELSGPALGPVCDHGESLDGECLQCRAEIVKGRETPAEIIRAESEPELRSMQIRDLCLGPVDVSSLADAGPVLVPVQRAPANTSPARWGLFSDGEFHIQKAGQRIELDRTEFEGLVAFLERMAA